VSTDGDDFGGTTAVVIASHGGPEAETIRAALEAGVGYIGLVASRVRGAAIVDGLGLDDSERARVHTPVGLAIGARTPPEIAVSILAEVIAAVRVRGLALAQQEIAPAAEAVDPVCGMLVTVGPTTPHLKRGDSDYWFCGDGCRSSFEARS
jgi:xanthine dehydrogenase accessory factor